MKENLPQQKIKAPKVPEVRYEPPRVAARLEGKVKNVGIKPVKKPKKS